MVSAAVVCPAARVQHTRGVFALSATRLDLITGVMRGIVNPPHHSVHPPLEPTRLRAAHMAPTGRRLHRLQECLGRWFAWFGICAINWILGFSCRILRWSVLSIHPLVVLSFHMLGKKMDLNLTTLLLFAPSDQYRVNCNKMSLRYCASSLVAQSIYSHELWSPSLLPIINRELW